MATCLTEKLSAGQAHDLARLLYQSTKQYDTLAALLVAAAEESPSGNVYLGVSIEPLPERP